jgi:hypothetical protein
MYLVYEFFTYFTHDRVRSFTCIIISHKFISGGSRNFLTGVRSKRQGVWALGAALKPPVGRGQRLVGGPSGEDPKANVFLHVKGVLQS